MGIVSHGSGGFGGGMDEEGGWYACGTNQRWLVEFREMSEHIPSARRYTDDTRSHRCPGAQLWVGSSPNWSVFLERS